MIYTSYYSNKMLKIAAGKFRLIGISRGIPEWFTGGVFRSLAPSWTMIRMRGTQNYISLYRSQVLAKLNPHEVMSILDNSILLCWEKAGRFCHRRLVAEWLEQATAIEVPEFPCQPLELAQLTLHRACLMRQ